MKTCPVCTIPKDLELGFYKNIARSDGYDWRCKECSSKYKSGFYTLNQDRIRYQNNIRHKENVARSLLRGARGRATRCNIPFDLDISDVIVPTHCPILGIELIVSKAKRNENSPSLDKIDNSKGYVKGNVQVVSWRANRLKGDGSRDEHKKIAKWMEVHESTN